MFWLYLVEGRKKRKMKQQGVFIGLIFIKVYCFEERNSLPPSWLSASEQHCHDKVYGKNF